MDFVLGYELNPHSPACVSRQQTREFLDSKFLVINLHDRPAIFVVVDQASQNSSSRGPLIAAEGYNAFCASFTEG